MGAITVTGAFLADFNFLCDRMELNDRERAQLRNEVRADFASVGAWVSETAAVYRFIDTTWGCMPTPDLCEGYLASKRWWPADSTIFKRLGIMLQAKLCAQVDGVIPGHESAPAAVVAT